VLETLRKYWHYYLAALLLALGIFFMGRAHAYENLHAIRHIQMHYCRALVYEDCKTPAQKAAFHKENAERCFKDVKEKCWYLPNMTHRKSAQYCLTNAGALCYPGNSKSKLIAVIINTMVQYGVDCCDEWHYIGNKLY